MKLQRTILEIAVIAGTVFGLAQITIAQPTKQPEGKPAISLLLSANPQDIKIDESTQLGITLKNISASELSVGRLVAESDDFDYHVMAVDDKGVEAPTTPYYRYVRGKRLPGDPHFVPPSRMIVMLKPDEVLKSQIKLDHLRLLDHAGTYTIWVERFDDISKSRVKSNTVTVTVNP
jgi:hypothetical protein